MDFGPETLKDVGVGKAQPPKGKGWCMVPGQVFMQKWANKIIYFVEFASHLVNLIKYIQTTTLSMGMGQDSLLSALLVVTTNRLGTSVASALLREICSTTVSEPLKAYNAKIPGTVSPSMGICMFILCIDITLMHFITQDWMRDSLASFHCFSKFKWNWFPANSCKRRLCFETPKILEVYPPPSDSGK